MKDLISRQAAIEAFICEGSVFVYGRDTCKAIVSRLMQIPSAQPEQGWIPCSERLPEKDGKYLVTNRKFGKLEATWNIFYGGDHASWLWNDEIVAWMPLPEPWRGEGHDTK